VRPTRLKRLSLVTLILTSFVVSIGNSPGYAAQFHASPTVRRGEPLTNTSAGLGTLLDSIDMITRTFGYGLASNDAFHPTSWVYLVRTSNAGSSWALQGALPYLAFHQSGGTVVPIVHFVSRLDGYISSGSATPGALFETSNGGLSWSKITTPGIAPTFIASSSTLAVVSYLCTHPNENTNYCPNELSLYRDGMTSPWRSVLIPRTSNVANRNAQLFASPAPGTFVLSEGDAGGGGQHSRLSLSAVSDWGSIWRHVDDPCASFGSDQLLTFGPRNWLLSCFLGEGMNSGIGNIWRTDNGGVSWSRVLHRHEEATTIVPSGNRRILFGEVGGATGGVTFSTNDGATWSQANINGQGGAPESLATIGGASALDDVVGGQIYRTTNGRTWSALPPLPAAPYRGISICTPRHVKVSLSGKPQKGFEESSLIIFTNQGARNCYLAGPPVAQTLDGDTHAAIGPRGYMGAYGQPRLVVLKGHGGKANAKLWISRTKGWSARTCAAASATGIDIDFGTPSDFVAEFRSPVQVCTGLTGLGIIVNTVQPGSEPHA